MKYDVIVVGGRIGGSISSFFASKNDLDVLMIEKRQEIGVPVQCAEGTSNQTFETLNMKPSKRYVCAEIEGADVYAPNGEHGRWNNGGKTEGFILDRKVFDKHLAIESAKAGTDIMVKTTVKDLIIKKGLVKGVIARHLGKIMEIETDLVIAADGVESNIARMAGLNTLNSVHDICSCAQYQLVGLDVDQRYIQLYFGNEIAPGGYAWIFPKGEGVASVGLGIRDSKDTAYNYLNRFISEFDATPVELNIGGVPISGPVDKTFTDGLMVVGDAARHVDPITGGGIHITAACAKVAGEVAAEAIKKEDTSAKFLERYEKLWKMEVGDDIKRSLKYRKILDSFSDEDINAIAGFLQGKDVESISKLSWLKFAKEYPKILKVIKGIL